jgi:hypothetical protein
MKIDSFFPRWRNFHTFSLHSFAVRQRSAITEIQILRGEAATNLPSRIRGESLDKYNSSLEKSKLLLGLSQPSFLNITKHKQGVHSKSTWLSPNPYGECHCQERRDKFNSFTIFDIMVFYTGFPYGIF